MEYSGRGGIHREERKPEQHSGAPADRQPAPNTTPSARPIHHRILGRWHHPRRDPAVPRDHGYTLDEVGGGITRCSSSRAAGQRRLPAVLEGAAGRPRADGPVPPPRQERARGLDPGLLLPHPRQRRRGARRVKVATDVTARVRQTALDAGMLAAAERSQRSSASGRTHRHRANANFLAVMGMRGRRSSAATPPVRHRGRRRRTESRPSGVTCARAASAPRVPPSRQGRPRRVAAGQLQPGTRPRRQAHARGEIRRGHHGGGARADAPAEMNRTISEEFRKVEAAVTDTTGRAPSQRCAQTATAEVQAVAAGAERWPPRSPRSRAR